MTSPTKEQRTALVINADHQDPPTPTTPTTPTTWTTKDKLLVLLNIFIKLGDSIEIYLPGIITQVVSCELGVSKVQEGVLGVALYVSLATVTLFGATLANRVGRRPLLLFSLYTSILMTLLCSVVPSNYPLLLAARLLIGLCVGLNISVSSVYVAENVSSHTVYALGTFIDSFFFAVGGGWVAVLGYFMLGHVNWRVFILFTSLPTFIPPLLILHCYLKEDTRTRDEDQTPLMDDVITPRDVTSIPTDVKLKILVASVANFVNLLQGYGCVLLLPSLLRLNKERDGRTGEECESAVQGTDFLVIALLTGGSHVVGRLLGYLASNRVPFRLLQSLLAVVMLGCYGALLLDDGLTVVVVALGVANVVYSMTRLELKVMECNVHFFGKDNLAASSGTTLGVGLMGAAVGTTLAEFLSPHHAVMATFGFSWALLGAVCNIKGYSNNYYNHNHSN